MKKQMDYNQTERKNINLTKDGSTQNSTMRVAQPIYKTNVDEEMLERREYRNTVSPQQQPYRATDYQPQQTRYDDPPPAINNYSIPPVMNQAQNSPAYQNQNDDLSRYYDYEQPSVPPSPAPIPQPVPLVQQPPVQQQAMKFCKYCGERIPLDAVVCTHCGRQVEDLKASGTGANNINISNQSYNGGRSLYESIDSDKSKTTSIILAALGFFGLGGLHRFYVGRPLSGILYLLTGGVCGLGTLIDVLKLASGTFTDGAGRVIKK
ncbi:MAG: TM2 domain-containing protein [Ruminococcus sp.]|nr:TM2 domain-containing protein [Ruminococcus sp.]